MVKLPSSSAHRCVLCKGSRMLCGRSRCPLLTRWKALLPFHKKELNENILGSTPPSFFVGRFNYPRVYAGPMIPPDFGDEVKILDEPDLWFGKPLETIVNYRSRLIRSVARVDVKNPLEDRLFDASRELVISSKPIDVEAKFEKPPKIRIDFNANAQPFGPIGKLKMLTISENPKVERVVNHCVYDYDLKAGPAIIRLYEGGLSVNTIQRILSAGLLGEKPRRRLVPTRWAITATDDVTSKFYVNLIKKYPEIGEYFVFKSSYLDNHFRVVLIPHPWAFEQMEAWYPGSAWVTGKKPVIVTDHEFYEGRKSYASHVAGAYYASRLGVTEYLTKIRRQAACVIFREVHGGYTVPLGVWQIRENIRQAFKNLPEEFSSLEEALKASQEGLGIPLKYWAKKSQLLNFIRNQTKITTYF